MKGEAADCYVPDPKELLDVLLYCKLPFDQAILYKRKKFLHLIVSGKWRESLSSDH